MTSPTVEQLPSSLPVGTRSGESFQLQPLRSAVDHFREQLTELYHHTPNPHPFLHPDSLQAQFADSGDDVLLATLWSDQQLLCAGVLDDWPFPVLNLPGLPLKWSQSGWRLFGKGLLWDGSQQAPQAWLQHLIPELRRTARAGLYVEALPSDSPLTVAWQEQTGPATIDVRQFRPQPLQPRWRVQLPDSVDEYWQSQFKGKTRNTLRRKRKKLGDYEIRVVTQPEDVPDFLAAASAVSQHTWQTKELGLRVKNSPQEHRLYQSLAVRGDLRCHLMLREQQPVAFAINTSHGGCLRFEETGFLPELSHLSPGLVLVSELIDEVIRSGDFRTLDFGLGHADYKQLFSNQESQSADVWLLRSCPQNSAATALIETQELTLKLVKGALQRTGLFRALRKLKRGH